MNEVKQFIETVLLVLIGVLCCSIIIIWLRTKRYNATVERAKKSVDNSRERVADCETAISNAENAIKRARQIVDEVEQKSGK